MAAATGSGRRGRPRSFDTDQVLDQSMEMFWRQGYQAVTTRSLENAVGISQSSLYNTFGSKEHLFNQTLDRYKTRFTEQVLAHLAVDDPRALHDFITAMATWNSDPHHPGCLLLGHSMRADDSDDLAHGLRELIATGVRPHVARLGGGEAIREQRVTLILACLQGLCLAAGTGTGPEGLQAIAAALSGQIRGWEADADSYDADPAPV